MSESSQSFHEPETWDEASVSYEALAEPHTRPFALALADRIRTAPGAKVIDIASGPGALAIHLADRGAQVTAIDHSPGMIARLNARARAAGLAERIEAAAMDGLALDFPDAFFDAALSAFGIFLFPDNEAGLREAARVVRPGGWVGLSTWEGAFGAGPSLVIHRAYMTLFPDRPIAFPCAGAAAWGDPKVLSEAMRAAGLVDVEVVAHEERWTFPSAAWVADRSDNMFRMFPAWSELRDADRAQLRNQIVESLSGEAPPSVPTVALLATGRKPGL